jgi:pyruvate kinase
MYSIRAKIICTIGPSSNDRETIVRMVEAGMDVARLNFSHGTHEGHREVMGHIREASRTVGKHVAVLQDLQGPKIRIGTFRNGYVDLKTGDRFVITTRDVDGDGHIVSTTYSELPRDVRPGDELLIDDGLYAFRVKEVQEGDVVCEVVNGGRIKNNKGMNLPGVEVSAPSLTGKDMDDLIFGIESGVDYVALSFVRKPEDVLAVKEVIRGRGKRTPVIAKIEKPQALGCIDRIIAISDGIMVARGDLGVEMKTEEVPPIQKQLIRLCNKSGVPVITATQMLDSMVSNPRPTRAEASDVANAIIDGTDAVMLSAETASGKYPIESITVMKQIVRLIEKEMETDYLRRRRDPEEAYVIQEGVAIAACSLAETLALDAIVSITLTGAMAQMVAKYRPRKPIVAITHSEEVLRRLSLVWGVQGLFLPVLQSNIDESVEVIKKELVRADILQPGKKFVVTAGLPFGSRGATNSVRVESI